MTSHSGRYVMVMNGEIYNHASLRAQLRTSGWRGHSDTETILECISAWGLEKALQSAVGMFALAVWDREGERLFLARDRMGEKPLYYGKLGASFAFASELKAMREFPGFALEVDPTALGLYMRYGYVPTPHCIQRGFAKLRPGSWFEVSRAELAGVELPTSKEYWSAMEVATSGVRSPLRFDSDVRAVDALEAVLSDAVAGQLMSDVPLGAFLSGGIDSSTVVALMQTHSAQPVRTFSIGFHESEYDEAVQAKAVARHLGTDHTELYVTSDSALEVIPTLPTIYDEPFADPSQIPTYLVAAMARQQVTVALSGDGGDELFAGYNRYAWAASVMPRVEKLPLPFRRGAAAGIELLSPESWDRIAAAVNPVISTKRRLRMSGDKLYKVATALRSRSGQNLYRDLVSHWVPESVVLELRGRVQSEEAAWPQLPDLAQQMMAMDAVTYLPDQILVKLDRAAMAVSLETRVPLLDHRVFEFAWRLPHNYKIRNGAGKWILRELLRRHVPDALTNRAKMGFAVPVSEWLRGPLREWAEELLSDTRLRREGFFDVASVRAKWNDHLSGRRSWPSHLWDVLMFQSWLETWTVHPASVR